MTARDSSLRRLGIAAAVDAGVVVAFAALGRRNHDEQPGVSGLVDTAWPFVVGLALGWTVARAWEHPTRLRTGVIVWPVAVVGGMVMRRLTGDGTAATFIVVASVFLGAGLVGWRAASARLGAGR